jgi:hypothetical protein
MEKAVELESSRLELSLGISTGSLDRTVMSDAQ